jgi:hypothetical protein
VVFSKTSLKHSNSQKEREKKSVDNRIIIIDSGEKPTEPRGARVLTCIAVGALRLLLCPMQNGMQSQDKAQAPIVSVLAKLYGDYTTQQG